MIWCKKKNNWSGKIITATISRVTLLCCLQPTLSLPTPTQTEMGEYATASVNAEVTRELDKGKENSRKRKAYIAFVDKDRA